MEESDGSSLAFQGLSAPSTSASYDGDSGTAKGAAIASSNEIINNLNHPHSNANTTLKLKEANAKYKQLLKLAKERIQAQEDELELLRTSSAVPSGGVYILHTVMFYSCPICYVGK